MVRFFYENNLVGEKCTYIARLYEASIYLSHQKENRLIFYQKRGEKDVERHNVNSDKTRKDLVKVLRLLLNSLIARNLQ